MSDVILRQRNYNGPYNLSKLCFEDGTAPPTFLSHCVRKWDVKTLQTKLRCGVLRKLKTIVSSRRAVARFRLSRFFQHLTKTWCQCHEAHSYEIFPEEPNLAITDGFSHVLNASSLKSAAIVFSGETKRSKKEAG